MKTIKATANKSKAKDDFRLAKKPFVFINNGAEKTNRRNNPVHKKKKVKAKLNKHNKYRSFLFLLAHLKTIFPSKKTSAIKIDTKIRKKENSIKTANYLSRKGKNAKILARFISLESILWCLAQLPVILRGTILPLGITNLRSISTFL